MSELLWWGYRHKNGETQVKRLLDEKDIQEAKASPFVAEVTGPFLASDRNDAKFKAIKLLDLRK